MQAVLGNVPVDEGTATRSAGRKAVSLKVSAFSAFYGRVQVLHGVDMDAGAGEVVGLLGANGAGKSSLLGALAGLVRSRGSVQVEGRDISRAAAHRRPGLGLALVPEVRGNLFSAMSVRENVQIALRRMSAGEASAAQDEIWSKFPILRERAAAPAGMLSGGEQQMLAIAVALGHRPKVLLLDEPTQGLAPSVFDVLADIFAKLAASGLSIVLAEQNIPFASRCVDRFIVLAGGKVSLRGDAPELSDHARLMSAYLGDDA